MTEFKKDYAKPTLFDADGLAKCAAYEVQKILRAL